MRQNKYLRVLSALFPVAALFFTSLLSVSFKNQLGTLETSIVNDSIPVPYPLVLADAINNITIHAHSINYIQKQDPIIDLSKVAFILEDKKVDISTLQQMDLYCDVLTLYPANNADMIATYGSEARSTVAVATAGFFEPKNTDLYPPPEDPTENKVFTKCQFPPTFPGGERVWNNYIRKIISVNAGELISNQSYGTCRVRFIVDKMGNVSDVEAISMQDSKLAKIAVDAVKNGPKWLPGRQNGHMVKAYVVQPLTFQIK